MRFLLLSVMVFRVLTAFCSWTFITWIVVIGSSLVMILWVVIYSYLQPNNFFTSTGMFVNEVEILFSNLMFWSTVVFSVLVALGKEINAATIFEKLTECILAPRFIYKFAQSTYFPLDKEIVREMWVGGDLKDRLGIKHRKKSKNTHSDLESAPMIRDPHVRSASELTLHQTYQPTVSTPAFEAEVDEQPPALATLVVPLREQNLLESQSEISPQLSYYSPTDIPASSPISGPQQHPIDDVSHMAFTTLSPTSHQSTVAYPLNTVPESYEMQEWHQPSYPPANVQPAPSGAEPLAGDGRHRPEEEGTAPDFNTEDSRSWSVGRAL